MVWKKVVKKIAKFLLVAALKSLWSVADKNKDGKISKVEAKEFWETIKCYFRA